MPLGQAHILYIFARSTKSSFRLQKASCKRSCGGGQCKFQGEQGGASREGGEAACALLLPLPGLRPHSLFLVLRVKPGLTLLGDSVLAVLPEKFFLQIPRFTSSPHPWLFWKVTCLTRVALQPILSPHNHFVSFGHLTPSVLTLRSPGCEQSPYWLHCFFAHVSLLRK